MFVFQLKEGGKNTSIRSFQDPTIGTALPVLDLIDSIKPGSINYDLVKRTNGNTVRKHDTGRGKHDTWLEYVRGEWGNTVRKT